MTPPPGIGSVIADRFVLESVAGRGGMGTVYRARDRQGGGAVALKLCDGHVAQPSGRFSREVRALAALRHPGIVAYVADGHAGEGRPFLAMEWLEGEDLARRLRRQRLTPREGLCLLDRVASALAAAHALGIVHRDLKPSNIFLRGGRVEGATLLDFGVARLEGAAGPALTITGSMVGTPHYMAPEQARGDRNVTPAADLFSLGSLFFECLTGVTPFAAERMIAVLAKIVFEEAPPLSSAWPGAPPPLERLVARLLAKAPSGRPASAAALVAELSELRGLSFERGPEAPAPSLRGPEHQILSVVLAAPSAPWASGPDDEPLHTLRGTFSRHAGLVEALADGSLALAFGQTGRAAATDRAAQAARCALLLKEQYPDARIAIATGRGVVRDGAPGGGALDRAARLLEATPPEGARGDDAPILIDEVTAGLIEASFALRGEGDRRQLLAESASLDPTRPLLGKPTPCVGRELDLSALGVALSGAVEEPGARVVVVRAPAGMGKSRLRHEFVRRSKAQYPDLTALVGRCDPMGAGSSYGLLGQMVRELCGSPDGAPADALRRRLAAWADAHATSADAPRLAAFLGELCGAPFADAYVAALRVARQDAGLMAEQITRAFAAFLRAECERRPLLLVFEDLHWGDKPTVRAVGAALRELADLPFFVLALARPDVDELFPRLWEEHGPTNLGLRALGRRPCERLCRGALGPGVPAATVERIVEQSGGNALFLEELIRAVAENKGDAPPESVLAMLQARLMRLAPEARRVLRAASVFGETFWAGGVRALLNDPSGGGEGAWLEALVEAEIVEREGDGRLAGEAAYRFRHALMRDAAYGMLAEEDRVAGHRAAGRFLEAAGEGDPMLLAHHFERGREGALAGEYYARAAELAHARGDASAVIARAELAAAQDLPDPLRARLSALVAEEQGWKLDFQSAGAVAEEVLRVAPAGSVQWATAIAPRMFGLLSGGRPGAADELCGQLCAVTPERPALAKVVFGAFAGAYWFYLDGDPARAARLLARQRELVEPVAHEEPLALGWYCLARSYCESMGEAGPALALRSALRCREAFRSIHHERGELIAQISVGKTLWMLGQLEEAEFALRATTAPGTAYGPLEVDRLACLIEVLTDRGLAPEACAVAEASLASMGRQSDIETICEGAARASYAAALSSLGEFDRAEREARAACELARPSAGVRLWALSTLSGVVLRRGGAAEALRLAGEALEGHAARKFWGPRQARAHLVRAEALRALGDDDGARSAIGAARGALYEKAEHIDDYDLRRSFLQDVPDHARTVELSGAFRRARGLRAGVSSPGRS